MFWRNVAGQTSLRWHHVLRWQKKNVAHNVAAMVGMVGGERHLASAVLPPPPRWVRVTVSTVRLRKETTDWWRMLSRAGNELLQIAKL